METRRSKRKEAAASDPTSEPRNKKARRTNADSKPKASANRKQKAQSAAGSAAVEASTAQAAEGAVHKASLASAPAVVPPVAAERPTAAAQEPSTKPLEDNAAEKRMASRKELAEAQERAAMEQVQFVNNLALSEYPASRTGLFMTL